MATPRRGSGALSQGAGGASLGGDKRGVHAPSAPSFAPVTPGAGEVSTKHRSRLNDCDCSPRPADAASPVRTLAARAHADEDEDGGKTHAYEEAQAERSKSTLGAPERRGTRAEREAEERMRGQLADARKMVRALVGELAARDVEGDDDVASGDDDEDEDEDNSERGAEFDLTKALRQERRVVRLKQQLARTRAERDSLKAEARMQRSEREGREEEARLEGAAARDAGLHADAAGLGAEAKRLDAEAARQECLEAREAREAEGRSVNVVLRQLVSRMKGAEEEVRAARERMSGGMTERGEARGSGGSSGTGRGEWCTGGTSASSGDASSGTSSESHWETAAAGVVGDEGEGVGEGAECVAGEWQALLAQLGGEEMQEGVAGVLRDLLGEVHVLVAAAAAAGAGSRQGGRANQPAISSDHQATRSEQQMTASEPPKSTDGCCCVGSTALEDLQAQVLLAQGEVCLVQAQLQRVEEERRRERERHRAAMRQFGEADEHKEARRAVEGERHALMKEVVRYRERAKGLERAVREVKGEMARQAAVATAVYVRHIAALQEGMPAAAVITAAAPAAAAAPAVSAAPAARARPSQSSSSEGSEQGGGGALVGCAGAGERREQEQVEWEESGQEFMSLLDGLQDESCALSLC
ncbi:hypothetical protein CLOP_g16340 [Closterium sp. NIES-67]|nr:hypothetical protein CLOP_g16340 [Closterium sp. NIES-67]